MELCLVHNDPSHTLLLARDGGTQYEIKTPQESKVTTIRRLGQGASIGLVASEVGTVESIESEKLKLSLRAHNMELVLQPCNEYATESSWCFTGPDAKRYKWLILIQYPVLILDDNSQMPIARYRRAKLGIVSRPRRAFLEIFPAGLAIVDLVVVTFVSFSKRCMVTERLSNS